MRRSAARALGLAAAALLGACGGREPAADAWIRLAALPVAFARSAEADAGAAAPGITRRDAAGGSWLSLEIPGTAWEQATPGTWLAPVPLRSLGTPPGGGPSQRLGAGGRAFTHAPVDLVRGTWQASPGSFAVVGQHLRLRLAPGQAPPAAATFEVFAARAEPGHGPLRVAGERFSGDGFLLRAGEWAELAVDVPAGRALRFATTVEPARPGSPPEAQVVFTVRLGGEPIFRHAAPAGEASFRFHRVPLPAGGAPGARLAFEVAGDLAHAAFVAPEIGPAGDGAAPAPPPDAPDLVVFLADTFRADNLAAYGGLMGVTPVLDALADRAVLFEEAWSVGTWTLPAHLSLFAGVHPPQAGPPDTALPEELASIAELLAARGYRTGAVTDSVFVSRRFGFDRGFSWFDEHHDTLDSTLERAAAFLDADDGRPVFLFVQSYRTHLPYRVSEETRAALGERLGLGEGDGFFGLAHEANPAQRELRALVALPRRTQAQQARLTELARTARAHYLGGVADLDRGFARFFRDLEARGLLERGYLFFTSDHGEAFLEHNVVYHSGPVWNELLRIPLLVWSGRLAPATPEWPVSLVDLPPTLAALAGVPPRAAWVGRPLFDEGGPRTLFAYQSRMDAAGTLALREGPHKVITREAREALESGEVIAAFDLLVDPYEQRDLARDAAWPAELLARRAGEAAATLEPLVTPAAPALDAEKREQLRAMGYVVD